MAGLFAEKIAYFLKDWRADRQIQVRYS